MAGIVQDCLIPRNKTQIMYKCNLSFSQTNAYLGQLTSMNLVFKQEQKYETTDKGLQFLSAYNQVDRILKMPASPIGKIRGLSSSSIAPKPLIS